MICDQINLQSTLFIYLDRPTYQSLIIIIKYVRIPIPCDQYLPRERKRNSSVS